jgi:hypothetical protein
MRGPGFVSMFSRDTPPVELDAYESLCSMAEEHSAK